MKRNALHSDRGSRRSRKGCCAVRRTLRGRCAFTLVEMLVVISIITVLVLIVVGVSQIVIRKAGDEETRLNMKVIRQAIKEYRIAKGDDPPDVTDFPDKPVEWSARNWEAYCRAKKLYSDLSSVPQARAQIANLGKDATANIDGNHVFVDGFGKYMEYFKDKGAGATPVIISAGADSWFGTDEEPERKKDNLRSDNK